MPLRGESIGTAYIRVIADGSSIADDVLKDIENDDTKWNDAGSRGAKKYKQGMADEFEKHDSNSLDNALSRALSKEDFAAKFFESDGWHKFEQNSRARFGQLGQDWADETKLRFTRQGSLDGIEHAIEGMVGDINNSVARLHEAGHEIDAFGDSVDHTSTRVDRDRNIFQRLGIAMADMSDKIKFGKGSRNDFVNFIGSFIVGANRMVATIPTLIGNLVGFKGAFSDAREAGQGFFSSITDGILGADGKPGAQSALGALFAGGPGGLIVGVLGLTAAFAGFVAVLGPIASLISGIAAAITALVASIAFAVAGVIAPLLGLIPPLAIGLGVVIAGMTGMSNQAKKAFKEGIKPLTDGFKELGATARKGFFSTFKVDSKGVSDALSHMNPLVRATGAALGDMVTRFTNGFKSKNFDQFVTAMTKFVPGALKSLGHSFSNLAGAAGNIFIDLIPTTRDFLGWLEKITGEFEKWTGSKKGRQDILQFLDDAKGSLKAVGDLAGPVTTLIGTLLGAGKGTGDSIFSDLGDQVSKLNQFIKKNPDALKNFFSNGKQVARDLGNVVKQLGRMFDTLDSPEARNTLHTVLQLTTAFFKVANVAIKVSNVVINAFVTLFHGVVRVVNQIVKGVINKFMDLVHWVGGLGPRLGHAFTGGGGGHLLLINTTAWIPGALSRISSFARRAASAMISGFRSITGPISSVVTRVVSLVSTIPGKLANLAGKFGSAAAAWGQHVVSAISSVPGKIVGLFKGLGARIVSAIGSISIHINWPSPPGWLSKVVPGLAVGGIVTGPMLALVGEAGREAVVPLDKPLSEVDPSVRWLAAIARGQTPPAGSGGTPTTTASGKVIHNNWNITTPANDSRAVATELLAQMVASAY